MTTKKFEDVREGDWVFTCGNGWEEVLSNEFDSLYRIETESNSYTVEGMNNENDKHPSAWTYDPFNGTEPPKPEIDWGKVERFTPVLALDHIDNLKSEQQFLMRQQDGLFVTYNKERDTIRHWNYCELACEPKEEWLK